MPHGGPEARDRWRSIPGCSTWSRAATPCFSLTSAARTASAAQFAESGYGEWGRKMQDDLTDGVKALVDQGLVGSGARLHRRRVLRRLCRARGCGAHARSVQVRGVDRRHLRSRRLHRLAQAQLGLGLGGLHLLAQGHRRSRQGRSASARSFAAGTGSDAIKIPILLIHGDEDDIVPIAQSKAMKKALDKAGRKTELITLKDEGHSYWSTDNEKLTHDRDRQVPLATSRPGIRR